MNKWLKVAFRRDVVIRGAKVGLFVGTILTAINQGDVILAGKLGADTAWKVLLTYLVPYCVSTYAGVSTILAGQESQNDL